MARQKPCIDCDKPLTQPARGWLRRCAECRLIREREKGRERDRERYWGKGLYERKHGDVCPICGDPPAYNCTYCVKHRVTTPTWNPPAKFEPVERNCAHCGIAFMAANSQQIYCRVEHRRRTAVHKWKPKDKSATQRGYGSQHQRTRKLLLPKAYGNPCEMCGELMLIGQKLDLDHSVPIALGGIRGDRIVHSKCNQRAGQELGRERAAQKKREAVKSRNWL